MTKLLRLSLLVAAVGALFAVTALAQDSGSGSSSTPQGNPSWQCPYGYGYGPGGALGYGPGPRYGYGRGMGWGSRYGQNDGWRGGGFGYGFRYGNGYGRGGNGWGAGLGNGAGWQAGGRGWQARLGQVNDPELTRQIATLHNEIRQLQWQMRAKQAQGEDVSSLVSRIQALRAQLQRVQQDAGLCTGNGPYAFGMRSGGPRGFAGNCPFGNQPGF